MVREQVVVAVSPRLLSDAVRRTLDVDGIATTDELDGPPCEVAVVSAGREAEVHAAHVITLSTDGAPAADGSVVDLVGLRAALTALRPRSG